MALLVTIAGEGAAGFIAAIAYVESVGWEGIAAHERVAELIDRDERVPDPLAQVHEKLLKEWPGPQ